MYFHQLQPAPLDLPEIIGRIRADLTLTDIRKCVLISSTWNKAFQPFLWETMYYSRFSEDSINGDPFFRRNGHFVRKLFTFGLNDKDMRTIAQYCSRLDFFHLEISRMAETNSFRDLFRCLGRLQRLVLKLSNAHGRSPVERAILDPIANGALKRLTELQIVGLESFQTLPAHQSGMLLRCLEGCPSLHTLELGSIRVVDTEKEWVDAINIPVSSVTTPRKDLSNPICLPPTVLQELESLNTTPDPGFKNMSVKVLRLWKIYGNQTVAAFVKKLIQRCPNVAILSLKCAPANLDTLANDCPRLWFFSLEHSGHPGTMSVERFLAHPSPRLQRLCLRRCPMLTDAMLSENVATALTQQGLLSLEITMCGGISAERLVRFVARCHTLEHVSIDRLLVAPVSHLPQPRWPSRPRGEHMPRPSAQPTGSRFLEPIQWRCLGIRYLDIYGIQGRIDTFENVLLDMLPRLEGLEFLGMRTQHIDWLMELEPLMDRHGTVIDMAGNSHAPLSEGILPRLAIMFGSITTLSLDPVDRRGDSYGSRCDIHGSSQPFSQRPTLLTLKQVRYLYCMFPKLTRIVYNGSTFPCTRDAWDWLSHPQVTEQHLKWSQELRGRTIKVVYRSQEEADTAIWKC